MYAALLFEKNLRTIALNEFRVRWFSPSTWVFFIVVLVVFLVAYLVEIHEFYDFWIYGYSYDLPIGPKYFMASMGTWFLVMTTLGAIFLGCSVRASSIHNRISEVVESRPITNLELVVGRLLSSIAITSIPVIFALVLMILHGYIDRHFGLAYGDVPEAWSVLAFVVWDIVPNLAFWGAFAMFLTMMSRSRLFGAFLTFLIYLASCVLTMGLPLEVFEEPNRVPTVILLMQAAPVLPLWLLESVQSFSASAMFPSELAPTFVTGPLIVQRLAMFLLVAGLACGAALFFPRSQVSRRPSTLAGFACSVIAISLLASMSYFAWLSTQQNEQWAATHTRMETAVVLDLEHVSGDIRLHPAHFMSFDLILRLRTPEHFQAKEGVFALNPGFRIEDLMLNGNRVDDYEFKDGLLLVPWDPKTTTAELQVFARGKPTESFAYLDAAINVSRLSGKQLRRLRNLGTKSSIFHSSYIALLPGVHWYPTPGAATGREKLDTRATDFHTFDLEITTKRNWIVAIPGTRERKLEDTPDTYHIQSSVPVPSIPVISSRFVRRAITVEGVEFELLISPHRQSILQHFAGIDEDLRVWLAERLQRARALGLAYPHERFSVIEVPSSLRFFGGGWQMDSILGPSGMFLVRESGLLSVRFERDEYRRWNDSEKRKEYVLSKLLNKLNYDLLGENPYFAFSKNFLTNQTKPTGGGAVALQFVIDQLITQLVMEHETYFSIQDLLNRDLYDVYSDLWLGKEFAGKFFDRPSVWFSSETISLPNLIHLPDPDMRHKVLWHKGYAIIRSLRDIYGSEGLSSIFRELFEQHRGGNFSYEDVAVLTPNEYKPINTVIGDLLLTTKAPGYIATQPSVSRVDVPNGTDQYLTSFVLYNDEESPGFIRVYDGNSPLYELEGDGALTEPIWMGAKQAQKISLLSNQPFRALHYKPYFSWNRAYTSIYPDPPDENTQWMKNSDIPPVVEPIDWKPPANEPNVVVVDDHDPGFSIVHLSSMEKIQPRLPRNIGTSSLRPIFSHQYYLPEFPEDVLADEWHRVKSSRGFGKYRFAWVRIKNGRGRTAARFNAVLPQTGLWQLEYHVINSGRWDRYVRTWYGIQIITDRAYLAGDIAITVHNSDNQNTTKFNITGSEYGWKIVGEYDLVKSDVAVLVSDAVVGIQGSTVYADAIRWTHLAEKTTEEPAQQ